MANSKYEYVRTFEQAPALLPNTFIIVRIDGRGFHQLSSKYSFEKPNDQQALYLMNKAAMAVMHELPDVVLGYGVSDEFRHALGLDKGRVFHSLADGRGGLSTASFSIEHVDYLTGERCMKIVTTVVSTFTAHYVHSWPSYFPDKPLLSPLPSFDGRAVQYPTMANLRDYLSWRQVDCHINNLYNTTFWALRKHGGMSAIEAEEQLKTTVASDKHEILFSRFKINYNNEPEMYKKGSVLYHNLESTVAPARAHPSPAIAAEVTATREEQHRKIRAKAGITVQHVDIIKDKFWAERNWLLSSGES